MRMAISPPRPTADFDPAAAAAQRLPVELRARREWLHEIRWRRVGPPRHVWLILAAIFVLHFGMTLALREAMRPPPVKLVDDTSVAVSLIEPPPLPEPVAHEPVASALAADQGGRAANAPAPPRLAPTAREVAPAAPNEQGSEAVVATPVVPKLFNADGSLRLPETQKKRDPLAPDLSAAAEMRARGHNVVRCQPTRFGSAFKPDESVGDEVARKYLSFIGLYNPHSAAKTAGRAADATANCDAEF